MHRHVMPSLFQQLLNLYLLPRLLPNSILCSQLPGQCSHIYLNDISRLICPKWIPDLPHHASASHCFPLSINDKSLLPTPLAKHLGPVFDSSFLLVSHILSTVSIISHTYKIFPGTDPVQSVLPPLWEEL